MKSKISFILQEQYADNSYPNDFLDFCSRKHLDTEIIIPERLNISLSDLRLDADFYFHRNHTATGLALLTMVEKYSRVANSAVSVMACQNKLTSLLLLHSHGINVPQTYLLGDHCEEWAIHKDAPFLAKEIYGNNSTGVFLMSSPEEIDRYRTVSASFFFQQYIPNDHIDIKLYCILDDITAVAKPSSIHKDISFEPYRIPVIPEFVYIADKCRDIFGLNIFGVDLIKGQDGRYYVIEINECSSFTCVQNLNEKLLGLIERSR